MPAPCVAALSVRALPPEPGPIFHAADADESLADEPASLQVYRQALERRGLQAAAFELQLQDAASSFTSAVAVPATVAAAAANHAAEQGHDQASCRAGEAASASDGLADTTPLQLQPNGISLAVGSMEGQQQRLGGADDDDMLNTMTVAQAVAGISAHAAAQGGLVAAANGSVRGMLSCIPGSSLSSGGVVVAPIDQVQMEREQEYKQYRAEEAERERLQEEQRAAAREEALRARAESEV